MGAEIRAEAISHLEEVREVARCQVARCKVPGARCKVQGARCKVKQERQQLIVFPDSGTVKCSNVPNLSALSRDA